MNYLKKWDWILEGFIKENTLAFVLRFPTRKQSLETLCAIT